MYPSQLPMHTSPLRPYTPVGSRRIILDTKPNPDTVPPPPAALQCSTVHRVLLAAAQTAILQEYLNFIYLCFILDS